MTSTSHQTAPADGGLTAGQGLARQLDTYLTLYRRTWRASVISSFVAPLFYVLAMGVLLGGFVDVPPDQLEGATSYLAFIVPGLIAAQAMTTAVGETTYPVMSAIKWQRTFHAQLATPLEVRDLVNAKLAFTLFRVGSTCGVFFLVLAPFGVFESWWGPVVAWFGTLLLGLAFATWVFAFSAFTRSEQSFGLIFRLGVFPMFLFSGAFFPIANLGDVGEWIARCTPLWQGVNLTRMLCLDNVDLATALVNVAVLAALAAFGWQMTVRSLAARLES
jgi:lipooligosaccharide transport system permease protein